MEPHCNLKHSWSFPVKLSKTFSIFFSKPFRPHRWEKYRSFAAILLFWRQNLQCCGQELEDKIVLKGWISQVSIILIAWTGKLTRVSLKVYFERDCFKRIMRFCKKNCSICFITTPSCFFSYYTENTVNAISKLTKTLNHHFFYKTAVQKEAYFK